MLEYIAIWLQIINPFILETKQENVSFYFDFECEAMSGFWLKATMGVLSDVVTL